MGGCTPRVIYKRTPLVGYIPPVYGVNSLAQDETTDKFVGLKLCYMKQTNPGEDEALYRIADAEADSTYKP